MFKLYLNSCPPSLNAERNRHWRSFWKQKGQWQRDLESLLLVERVPRGLARVHATASLRFPVQRSRDEGNFRWMLEKALGDALVTGGWLTDDTAKQFTVGAVTFEDELGPKRTTITLEVVM